MDETKLAEDLEDGEIESDGEGNDDSNFANKEQIEAPPTPQKHRPKEEKKKKSKNHTNKDEKKKEKTKKKHPGPVEDDFAGNIEKAIRRAMKNDLDDTNQDKAQVKEPEEENREGHRKSKKRKKRDNAGPTSKKRMKKKHSEEEINDEELMFTRGASPVLRSTSPHDYQSDDSYGSNVSYEDHRHHQNRPPVSHRNRPPMHARKNMKTSRDRRRENMHPMQDPDGVCMYFMQGKCHKGDDCAFSHNAEPPRKMELCKFYLMECCAKRDKCLYMHSDFPCKYFYTGLPCIYNDDCKFAHGPPLTDNLKTILLKHIESAPKEILGDFPRLSRETATMMITTTHMRLLQQYSSNSHEMGDMGIPSIFDMNVQKPNHTDDNMQNSGIQNFNHFSNDRSNKNMQKVRQSRWQQANSVPNLSNIVGNPTATQDVLSIKNLTGVLTPRQIGDLAGLGIENLNQLSQLTVIQLNQLGLNLKQINEIQLNTLNIQKLGLIDGGEPPDGITSFSPASAPKDLDMRVAPVAPEVVNNPVSVTMDALGQDIDMRFQSSTNHTVSNSTSNDSKPHDPRINKDAIDIDQYTKDALKFASKEKENIDNMSTDINEDNNLIIDVPKTKDVDQRVLQYVKDTPITPLSETDTDIRFLHPDNFSKKPAKRHRRSTTDDDENNLLIDEKCYSSDEDKSLRTKSPKQSPRPITPPMQSPTPSAVLNKLGDLSKIDISDEITKLLNTMKNKTQENLGKQSPSQEHSKSRDPRSLPKKSPDHNKSPSTDFTKLKKPTKISIYDCVEGELTDGRKRTDVDLRQLDPDFRLPAFGDTDFRQNTSSGDIDFRYGLPFKPLPNYTPATEIDGSINTHAPIQYKLKVIDIPRPDYTDIKNSTAKSQAMADPRLRKLFRLSIDESSSESEKLSKSVAAPRADPRKKPTTADIVEQHKPASLDLQNVTNSSAWYKDLSTNQKIFVNQQLAAVNILLKKHQQEKHLGKPFDKTQILGNQILCSIFNNLGVAIDDNGDITQLNKSQENPLQSPPGFNNSSQDTFAANMGMMNPVDNIKMMNAPLMPMGNMGPMGSMNMNPMTPFNGPFSNPDMRPPPGLLGYAPNMPHRFDGPNFGPPNFENFHANMPMNNGPGNDFSDESFHRNQNRGNYRGRGNDRWNRGGNHGNRDRRNYDERGGGSWKNERHN